MNFSTIIFSSVLIVSSTMALLGCKQSCDANSKCDKSCDDRYKSCVRHLSPTIHFYQCLKCRVDCGTCCYNRQRDFPRVGDEKDAARDLSEDLSKIADAVLSFPRVGDETRIIPPRLSELLKQYLDSSNAKYSKSKKLSRKGEDENSHKSIQFPRVGDELVQKLNAENKLRKNNHLDTQKDSAFPRVGDEKQIMSIDFNMPRIGDVKSKYHADFPRVGDETIGSEPRVGDETIESERLNSLQKNDEKIQIRRTSDFPRVGDESVDISKSFNSQTRVGDEKSNYGHYKMPRIGDGSTINPSKEVQDIILYLYDKNISLKKKHAGEEHNEIPVNLLLGQHGLKDDVN